MAVPTAKQEAVKEHVVKALEEAGVIVEVRVGPAAESSNKESDGAAKKDKKEDKEPKPKPSGIKPRQFLLLSLALMIMTVPIVALVLPVFLSARSQRNKDDSRSERLCVVPVPFMVFGGTTPASQYFSQLDAACDQWWTSITTSDAIYNSSILGYASLLVTVSTIDPLNLATTLNVNIEFGGNITSYRRTLNVAGINKNVTLNMDMFNTAGADVVVKQGDRSLSKTPRYTLTQIKSLFNYPFDKYAFNFTVSARLENPGNSSQFQWLPVGVTLQTGYVGWKISVKRSPDPWYQMIAPDYDAYIEAEQEYAKLLAEEGITVEPNQTYYYTNLNSTLRTNTVLGFNVEYERTGFVKFFSIMLLTGMWLLVSFLIGYGIDACYLRPRNVTMGDAGLFTGMLFALPGIRNAMPSVPPVGVAIDFFGFVWLMMLLMLTAVQVSSRTVMLYVHPEPTLWDKVFKTEAYKAWLEDKKKKEEEEKKKKEEEAKKKEEEETRSAVKQAAL